MIIDESKTYQIGEMVTIVSCFEDIDIDYVKRILLGKEYSKSYEELFLRHKYGQRVQVIDISSDRKGVTMYEVKMPADIIDKSYMVYAPEIAESYIEDKPLTQCTEAELHDFIFLGGFEDMSQY